MAKANNGKPTHAVTIRDYAEYREDIQRFVDGSYNFLIVIGNTGIGKTQTLTNMLEDGNPLHIQGSCPSAYQFYQDLHEHLDEMVILDDVSNKFFKDHKTNSYLKILTNTVKVKTLQWNTAAQMSAPDEYDTTSRVIILTNEWDSINEHVKALEGRAYTIIFEPTPEAVHLEVGKWFTDQEVYEYVWENRKWISKPDMRLYVKILEQKKAGADWRKRGFEMIVGNDRMKQIVELMSDPKLTSNIQRSKQFQEMGWGSESTFYAALAELRYYKTTKKDEACPKLKHASGIDETWEFEQVK